MHDGHSKIVEATGQVKWFDPKKGFGFIVGPDGQDIFVHYSKIQGDGFRVLKDGSMVTYDAELSDKGWHASRVVRAESLEVVVPKRTYSRTPRR
jgi:CspA family cold shock protein